jgi:hypothetical protein
MKTPALRSLAFMMIACLTICFTSKALAAPPGDLLVQAYVTLSRADHDYKGHRMAAMKQVEEAGKVLGINVHGDGRARENQGTSDDQLRSAQDLLGQAAGNLQGVALKHVNNAINQINIALKIK